MEDVEIDFACVGCSKSHLQHTTDSHRGRHVDSVHNSDRISHTLWRLASQHRCCGVFLLSTEITLL